jgi:N6-adenosine-specific RNA methylase IME4
VTGPFDVVLADPPWLYNDKSLSHGGGAESHYACMGLGDLMALPVESIASDDSLLFMWTTWPMIQRALVLGIHWGFEYKTIGFVWVKTNPKAESLFMGMGNWTRSNSEPCLLFKRGRPKRLDAGVHSVVISPRLRHSEKPAEVRTRIDKLVGPMLPKVELFARERTPGWAAFGNEIESDPIFDHLED